MVLRDVTWGERLNKQMCCLAHNYLLKTNGNLEVTALRCFGMFLQCINCKRSMSCDLGSKVKKLINFANIVQSKAFKALML